MATYTDSIPEKLQAGDILQFNLSKSIVEFPINFYKGELLLECWGAAGGTAGSYTAYGGYSKGTLKVFKGDTLYIVVGGKGTNSNAAAKTAIVGGYNGGGKAGYGNNAMGASAGGGASDIRLNGTGLINRIIVAGGGGGSHKNWVSNHIGGAGGGTSGGNGQRGKSVVIAGGTQTSGYALGQGQPGGNSSSVHSYAGEGRAGGGGGYWGGCASTYVGNWDDSTGGGGSGYIGGVINGSMSSGVRNGNGFIKITVVDLIDNLTLTLIQDLDGIKYWTGTEWKVIENV